LTDSSFFTQLFVVGGNPAVPLVLLVVTVTIALDATERAMNTWATVANAVAPTRRRGAPGLISGGVVQNGRALGCPRQGAALR
jgi:hypothetical protein